MPKHTITSKEIRYTLKATALSLGVFFILKPIYDSFSESISPFYSIITGGFILLIVLYISK
jgi:hypothetical protein